MENFDYDLQSVQETRNLARQGKLAQTEIATFNSEQIDKIIRNMVKVAEENAVSLAKLAVEETGFGKVEDKIFKNKFASTELYEFIKPMQTIGVIKDDKVNKVMEIAEPVGLLMGIIPSTNPTSTAIYKSIIAIKSRNGIVFSPHPSALKCTLQAAKLMHDAAVAAGAPVNIIGCISKPSMGATNELMKCDEVAMIIATGGSAMVKAAYSAGKPALGVGPGNVPAYIEKTANITKAVKNIIASKTFDNGTICASEQSVIVEEHMRDQVMAEFRRQGGYFMTAAETAQVAKNLFVRGHAMNAKMVGRSAEVIAASAGISVPQGTKVLLGEQQGVGEGYPLSYEKLTTVLAFYTVKEWHEACDLCIQLLNNGGVGHSLSIHTENPEMAIKFAEKPVFRILVNTSSSQGGVGASTGLSPAFTLGCGTWGGSATSDNVTPMHLINIKRIAYGIKDFSENASSSYVAAMPQSDNASGISEAEILTLVDEVISLLRKEVIANVGKYEALAALLLEVLKEGGDVSPDDKAIPVGTSNRHIHLSQSDLDSLFGVGYQLTNMKELSQPMQYACKETLTIAGPKGAIEKVRILGPVRKASQVEILQADCFKLGIKAPIKMSGDLQGTPAITLVGPKGSILLPAGLMIAQRHIHMTPGDAIRLGVTDGEQVSIQSSGLRGGTYSNVVIRATSTSKLECHIDTEEANAMTIGANATITIIK